MGYSPDKNLGVLAKITKKRVNQKNQGQSWPPRKKARAKIKAVNKNRGRK